MSETAAMSVSRPSRPPWLLNRFWAMSCRDQTREEKEGREEGCQ